jgi:hypothetical protein
MAERDTHIAAEAACQSAPVKAQTHQKRAADGQGNNRKDAKEAKAAQAEKTASPVPAQQQKSNTKGKMAVGASTSGARICSSDPNCHVACGLQERLALLRVQNDGGIRIWYRDKQKITVPSPGPEGLLSARDLSAYAETAGLAYASNTAWFCVLAHLPGVTCPGKQARRVVENPALTDHTIRCLYVRTGPSLREILNFKSCERAVFEEEKKKMLIKDAKPLADDWVQRLR